MSICKIIELITIPQSEPILFLPIAVPAEYFNTKNLQVKIGPRNKIGERVSKSSDKIETKEKGDNPVLSPEQFFHIPPGLPQSEP
jgi:hypothetical protein